MNGRSVGAVVGAAFGCAWGVAGATALPVSWRVWGVVVSIGIFAALTAAHALSRTPRASRIFRGRVYGIAVGLEVVGIILVGWMLQHFSLSRFLLPAIGFVVGLHFIGLWKATDLSLFSWTAIAMCLVCIVAAFLPGTTVTGGLDMRRIVTGLGCALVLWIASTISLC
jgi:hypothetical protein